MRSIRLLAATLAAAGLALAAAAGTATAQDPATSTIATGLRVPWGIAFLPDRSALVSERVTGRIWRISPNGSKRVVMRVPGVDTNAGEGGLLGLAVSPNYARDRLVYAYFTTARDNRIVRFRLGGRPRAIVTGIRRGVIHNGGRIAFGPDGKLYAGVGETGDTGLAQDRSSQNGKILRMNPNGSVPPDNPFKGSRVWSSGPPQRPGPRLGLARTACGRPSSARTASTRSTSSARAATTAGRSSRASARRRAAGSSTRSSPGPPRRPRRAATRSSGAPSTSRRSRASASSASRSRGRALGAPTRLLAGRFGRLRTVAKAPDGSLWVMTSNRDGRGQPRAGDDKIIRVAI